MSANVEAFSHGISGAVGGIAAMTLLYPLENIRTRLQVVEGSTKYKGSWDCFIKTIKEEHWSELYNGLSSALVAIASSSAVYFFWYHNFKMFLLKASNKKSLDPVSNMGVACVAGTVNVFFTLPIWVINTRMTLSHQYNTIFSSIKQIYQQEGIQGFYKGLIPSLILVSNPAIQFVVYEQTMRYLQNYQKQKLTSLHIFVVGAFAKAVATVFTYPYQVVKSRMQARKDSTETTIETFVNMFKNEGISAMFNGMSAKLLQTVMNSAFMFVVYENIFKYVLALLKFMSGQTKALPVKK